MKIIQKKSEMDLSIVIVNYNTALYLKSCLRTLTLYTDNLNYEIIVVDNFSPERDIEKLSKDFPRVKFIFSEENNGFGAGCNIGARNAAGRYILFVNPDVIFMDNINFLLFSYLEKNSNVALISPVYLEEDGKIEFTDGRFPGYFIELSEAFDHFISKVLNIFFKKKEPERVYPFEVNWVMGSYMMVRSEIFHETGGFDEHFFLYYEDIDLQFRIKSKGFKIMYHPGALLKHVKRSSVRTFSGENLYYYHMMRSKLIYMYKHFSFFKRNVIKLIHILGLAFRFSSLPFRKVFKNKRRQKMIQYKMRLKQILAGKKVIYGNDLFRFVLLDNSRQQVVSEDKFWK